jgi:hypothetical protein
MRSRESTQNSPLAIPSLASDLFGPTSSPWYHVLIAPASAADIKREQIKLILFTVLLLIALNLYAPAQPTVRERLLASIFLGLAVIPAWRWSSGKDPGLAFLPLIGCLYATYYALPIFCLKKYSIAWYLNSTVPDDLIENALMFLYAGFLAMLAGYYLPLGRRLAHLLPAMHFNWRNAQALELTGVLLGTIGCLFYYIGLPSRAFDDTGLGPVLPANLRQIIFFLGEGASLGIGILYLLSELGAVGTFTKVYLWGFLVPTRALLGFATGFIYQTIELALLLLLLRSGLRRKIPWGALFVGLCFFYILQPAKTLFRTYAAQESESKQNSPIERARAFLVVIGNVATHRTNQDLDAVQMTVDRLNYLTTFSNVVRLTPEFIPFWWGETYKPLAFKLVPKEIFPAKPDEIVGQTFGHRYSLLMGNDSTTSYNLPQLIEAYVNFGPWGVVLIMFAIGTIYSMAQALFVHPEMGFGSLVCGGYLLSQWLNVESNASLVLGGFPSALLFFGLIHVLVSCFDCGVRIATSRR